MVRKLFNFLVLFIYIGWWINLFTIYIYYSYDYVIMMWKSKWNHIVFDISKFLRHYENYHDDVGIFKNITFVLFLWKSVRLWYFPNILFTCKSCKYISIWNHVFRIKELHNELIHYLWNLCNCLYCTICPYVCVLPILYISYKSNIL